MKTLNTSAASAPRAVSESGNGGNLEVSGGYLDFEGTIDTTAANGSVGKPAARSDQRLDSGPLVPKTVNYPAGPYAGTTTFTNGNGNPSILTVANLVLATR